MYYIRFIRGSDMRDFYFLPTIRYERHCEMRYLTMEWLKWYVGLEWEVDER
jgi:hypothetical protein